jgi:hypothetical protein
MASETTKMLYRCFLSSEMEKLIDLLDDAGDADLAQEAQGYSLY